MAACSKCNYANIEGAIFCENCGNLLVADLRAEQVTNVIGEEDKAAVQELISRGTSTFTGETQLTLELGKEQITHSLNVADGEEITLGRVDQFTTILPSVNLAEQAAWERGVSRIHAAIKRDGDNLYLIDLSSTNGTFLNGVRVAAREPQLLSSGDVVRLALFPIKVHFVAGE